MTHIGVRIPEGFTISTEVCALFYENGKKLPEYVVNAIFESIKGIEKKTGKVFGGDHNPLLVSVRSGARASMPGMMDTILNLGLNDTTAATLAKETRCNGQNVA
jgi:pyruvate,orthophosphate dikinase